METGQQHALTNDEAISLLVQSEWEEREGRKVDRYLKNARFRYQASIEELDFNNSRSLDKTLIMRLAEGSFIKRKEDILLTGPTGVGKSSGISSRASGLPQWIQGDLLQYPTTLFPIENVKG